MELHAEINKEIMDILTKMFPTPDRITKDPSGTYVRVRRLMLLAQKLVIVVDGNRNDVDLRDIDRELAEYPKEARP